MGERVSVLLVGLEEAEERLLQRDDAFSVERAAMLEAPADVDALVVAVPPGGPLEALRNARRFAPEAAISSLVMTGWLPQGF